MDVRSPAGGCACCQDGLQGDVLRSQGGTIAVRQGLGSKSRVLVHESGADPHTNTLIRNLRNRLRSSGQLSGLGIRRHSGARIDGPQHRDCRRG